MYTKNDLCWPRTSIHKRIGIEGGEGGIHMSKTFDNFSYFKHKLSLLWQLVDLDYWVTLVNSCEGVRSSLDRET